MAEVASKHDSVSLRVTFPKLNYALVELNLFASQNEYPEAICSRLQRTFDLLSKDPQIRSIVISIDTSREDETNLMSVIVPELNADVNEIKADQRPMLEAVRNCGKPIICVNHGGILQTTLQIACASSIRICSSKSQFGIPDDGQIYTKIHSEISSRIENHSLLREFALTGKPCPANDAKRLGFISSVWETKHEAVHEGIRLATQIAERRLDVIEKILDMERGRDIGIRNLTIGTGISQASGKDRASKL